MAKTILGVDIGSESLKLALVTGGEVKRTVAVPIPGNLVREYRVVSTETMGELIRNTLKAEGIRARDAAVVLPNEMVYVRSVTMPRMTTDQLVYNLPFEFRDYITEELKDYVYDYAMISTPEELKSAPVAGEEAEEAEEDPDLPAGGMELLAVAAPIAMMTEYREMLRKAGLRMVRAAPTGSCYIALIRRLESQGRGAGEYCILDLGYQAIRMYMFRGEQHMVTRNLEIGLSGLDEVIADAYSVDVHLAHTYLLTNYNGCQESEACRSAYGNIAVELMRAMNFYRFSNPDSQLGDIWLCGGGAAIAPLRAAIAETLDLRIHQAEELVPRGETLESAYALAQAVGITLE